MYYQIGAKDDKNPQRIFHKFDHDIHHAIVKVTMRDMPATWKRNNNDLQLQAKARCVKEEMARKRI